MQCPKNQILMKNLTLIKYITYMLIVAFAFATLAVTFVVLFSQSFRFLALVVNNSATAFVFFTMLAVSSIIFLPIIMPLGIGAAVGFVYNKMSESSELIIMRACGMANRQIILPALIMAALVAVLGWTMTLWVSPMASRVLSSMRYETQNNLLALVARPGTFNDVGNDITFFINKKGQAGSLQGILIHDARNSNKLVTIMADSGNITKKNNEPQMTIFNGRQQEFDKRTGYMSELVFDQYVFDIQSLARERSARTKQSKELSVFDLLNKDFDASSVKGGKDRMRAELHSRFATPFLSFSYTLIILASILVGSFNRRGMIYRILIGAVSIVVVQAVFMTAEALVLRDSLYLWLLYAASVLPAVFCFFLIQSETYFKRKA
ncbi:MAG: LptF/LptG family permease, partial [Alphaproteobacteria bacterium]|nr:LptF/LptG family permease [Alphaproteobacteria bacterium]